MIDVTPSTDVDTEVQRGDKVRVSWLLDASVDRGDLTLTETTYDAQERQWTGDELSEEEVVVDDDRHWRYYKDLVLPAVQATYEWHLDDPVNSARDTTQITAQI